MAAVEGRARPVGDRRIEVRSQCPLDVVAYRRGPAAFPERLATPVSGADRLTPLTDAYAWLRAGELVHSGLVQIDGVIHPSQDDRVVELELPAAHGYGADGFLFHPELFEADGDTARLPRTWWPRRYGALPLRRGADQEPRRVDGRPPGADRGHPR